MIVMHIALHLLLRTVTHIAMLPCKVDNVETRRSIFTVGAEDRVYVAFGIGYLFLFVINV